MQVRRVRADGFFGGPLGRTPAVAEMVARNARAKANWCPRPHGRGGRRPLRAVMRLSTRHRSACGVGRQQRRQVDAVIAERTGDSWDDVPGFAAQPAVSGPTVGTLG
jgi:hypothetical protein